MRLTVGPLPAAVYWRRRAVVLGALLLFLMVVIYSCSGSGNTGEPTGSAASPGPDGASSSPGVLTPETGAPPSSEESPPPAASGDPGSEGDSGASSGASSGGDQGGAQPAAGGAAPGGDTCTDAEISVVPVPSQSSPVVGVTIELRLKIKNISDRTCKRDVGADPQEIYIKQGARLVWSSDACGTAKGSKVESFSPNFEREYRVSWNGREASRCVNGEAAGGYPQPGEYQLFGRVDSKVSAPVKLVIRA